VNVVLLLFAITFIVLGIGESSTTDSVVKAGGWLGLATAIAAWYASFAGVTNKTFGRAVMPVKELGRK
jgi:succinate-acetate transporter protein